MKKPTSIITTQNMIDHAQHLLAHQMAKTYRIGVTNADTTPITVTQKYFDPRIEPSWKIPLSELVTLWRVNFGDVWVDVSELDDVFWHRASMRLAQNKLFELGDTNDGTPWCRLKEDA